MLKRGPRRHHSGVASITWRARLAQRWSATLPVCNRRPAFTAQPRRLERSFSSDESLLNLARMSLTQMPKYLSGDKAAIEAFIDQFDVRTPRRLRDP